MPKCKKAELLQGTLDMLILQVARLQEEARYLEELRKKLPLYSSVGGVVTTPRLREKLGQYFAEGELICEVEEPSALEAEIEVAEQDVARVQSGLKIELKARALPFQSFQAQADRIAPNAVFDEADEVQSTVTVYCRLDETAAGLRPGMTGYARIYCGRRPVGEILANRVLRFLRTEFWW